MNGLCNYLRVIFSYYYYAKNEGKTLEVHWKVTKDCPGYFEDYFEKVDGIDFIRRDYKNIQNEHFDYVGCDPYPQYYPDYEKLELLPYLKEKINKISCSNTIAIHIRRTDHIEIAKQHNSFTSDEEFIKFINSNPNTNVYIATDNKDTQNMLINIYGDRIKFYEKINKPKYIKRHTTLEHTIIDIFMCIQANKFMGSNWSSMSDMIYQIRKMREINNNE